jgi:hypothetical protein
MKMTEAFLPEEIPIEDEDALILERLKRLEIVCASKPRFIHHVQVYMMFYGIGGVKACTRKETALNFGIRECKVRKCLLEVQKMLKCPKNR